MLAARDVTVQVGGRRLLDRVSIELDAGELLVLVGPNGAGKSTLLGCLAGDRPAGVELMGRPLLSYGVQERSRHVAVMAQESAVPFGFTALEVVRLGRLPHGDERCDVLPRAALERVGAAHLSRRSVLTLSGGERRRVAFARALVQLPPDGPRALLLDEPTAGLDLRHQHELLTMAREQARAGAAVLAVLHDLALAARYADRVALLDEGRLVAVGHVDAVLTPARIARSFGVSACRVDHPMTGEPCVLTAPAGHSIRTPILVATEED